MTGTSDAFSKVLLWEQVQVLFYPRQLEYQAPYLGLNPQEINS